MIYLPGNKDTIEPPHECKCLKCNKTLTTGVGYFVIDENGREYPTGPTCFEKLTGVRAKYASVLALGAVKENGIADEETLRSEYNENAKAKHGKKQRASSEEVRLKAAKANVLLRAKKLPERGFTNTDKKLFEEFLLRIDNLNDQDVLEIEKRIDQVAKRDERKSLHQLQWCNTVYGQVQRLLAWKEGHPGTKIRISYMQKLLRQHNGLINGDIQDLAKWSKAAVHYNIPNSIEGISFPSNQARYDRFNPK